MGECSAEMPKYKCHKIVHALKIKDIVQEGYNIFIVPEEKEYAKFPISEEYMQKHHPHTSGYYVVYEDGYKSFLQRKHF